jgi:uncharacterized protein (TIGR00369 family)
VETVFRGDATQAGYDGVVHGGIVAALLDELTGWAVSLQHDLLAYTGKLTIRFARPVPVGSECRGRSRVTGGRGKVWEAEGELTDDKGEVLARAQGTYVLLSAEQTAEVASKMRYLPGDLRVFRGDRKAIRKSEQEGERTCPMRGSRSTCM